MASPSTEFPVTASAGTLREDPASGWTVPHQWTSEGVVVEGDGNGAAVLHLSVALCVLNDTFREGEALGVPRLAGAGAGGRQLRPRELGLDRRHLRRRGRLLGAGRRDRAGLWRRSTRSPRSPACSAPG